MPDQINKVSVEGTVYQITPSSDGTFDGTSEDTASPSSWTTVTALASGETNGSIFTKISQMFKNIRFLYNSLGSTDISSIGNSVTDAIAALSSNKADSTHTHSLATSTDAGFMPALDGSADKCLLGDGTWGSAGSTYADVTTTSSGLMTSTDKVKLDTIATSANNYTHPSYTSAASGLYKVSVDATGHVSGTSAVAKEDITALGIPASDTNTTYANFTSAAAGLVPAAKSGTTNCATTGYVLTGAGWAAGTKYNTDTNTTYAFSNNAPTLAWNTVSTVGTVGGVALTVKLPANPNTNTTYGTNTGCYGSLSGTTLTLNARNFRV